MIPRQILAWKFRNMKPYQTEERIWLKVVKFLRVMLVSYPEQEMCLGVLREISKKKGMAQIT